MFVADDVQSHRLRLALSKGSWSPWADSSWFRMAFLRQTDRGILTINYRANTMTQEDTLAVRVTREYEQPAEAVFDAWLDSRTAGRWLFATPAGCVTQVRMEPRVGGTFRVVDRRDGEDVVHEGEYLELVRPERLVFVFAVPKYSDGRARVAIDIALRPGGCALTLTQELPPGMEEWADRIDEGWRGILAGLAALLGHKA